MLIEKLKNKALIQGLLEEIKNKSRSLPSPIKIMEVCGTHTMALHRSALRKILEDIGIKMLSGPGCPVCVTPSEIHEAAIGLITENNHFVLATFGDITRVPTPKGSLQTTVPAPHSSVKILYSPEESLSIAKKHPNKEVIFLGVGFETTIPTVALTVKEASRSGLKNFSILSAFRLVPPALKAIVEAPGRDIHGFLYPGHVSAIIGEKPYAFVAEKFNLPGAIAGFEPADILLALISILDQMKAGKADVINKYTRVVKPSGNPTALAIMRETLAVTDSLWRGIGIIPESGLQLKPKYVLFDSEHKFGLNIKVTHKDLAGCRCGDILQGKIDPLDCPSFGSECKPDTPLGPCMVSHEGACLAYFKYNLT